MAQIKDKSASVFLLGILVAALAFLFLVIAEKNYKVSTEFLVVENKQGTQDFYSLSKSAEYMGRVLGEAVRSEIFINEVIKTGKVDREFLPFDKKRKISQWNKEVKVSNNFQLGIIHIEVFNNNRTEALTISEAVKEVLTQKSKLFLGENQTVEVKVISGPIAEKNPDIKTIAMTMAGGFILGALIFIFWLYYNLSKSSASFALNNQENYNYNNPDPSVFESYNESLDELVR